MKHRILVLFISILLSCGLYAQKEMNWWFFGYNAGLNFNQTQTVAGTPNMPTPVNGPISTSEGCFTLSDMDGNLLMSSDGSTVYNSLNQVMENGTGLKGHASATQSGIVVPHPSNLYQYYIITVPCRVNNPGNGINYSIVDFSENGGLGKVIEKNTSILSGNVSEDIAAIAHSNKRDFWLVHRDRNKFYVWGITPAGISAPSIYTVGSNETVLTAGYTKFSADGKILLSVIHERRQVVSADFDPSTGIISDIRVNTNIQAANAYSIEISPSKEWVYLGVWSGHLYKIKYSDLRANLAPTQTTYNINTLQVGPDRRIYGTLGGSKNLYVIMDPDNGGTDIRTFNNYLTNDSRFGLPTFAASWLYDIKINGETQPCLYAGPQTYTLKIVYTGLSSEYENLKYFEWDWGDGSPVEIDYNIASGTIQSHQHQYRDSREYRLEVTAFKESTPGVFTPIVDFSNSLVIKPSRCVMPVNPNIHLME